MDLLQKGAAEIIRLIVMPAFSDRVGSA